MQTVISSFLHSAVSHPQNRELKGVGVKVVEGNHSCKRTTGPYTTEKMHAMAVTLKFPEDTTKQEIEEAYALNKKFITAGARAGDIVSVLKQRGLYSLENYEKVIDPLIYHRQRKVPIEKKLILSEPSQPFNAWEAVASIFPVNQPAPVHAKIDIPAPTAPVTSIRKLIQGHLGHAGDEMLYGLLSPLMRRKKGRGEMQFERGKFDPSYNFLEYLIESIDRETVSLHTQDKYENVKQVFLEFFTLKNRVRYVWEKPQLAFWDFDEDDLAQLRKWMLKNGYKKTTCNCYFGYARSAFTKARKEGIITEHFNAFHNYKIPQGPVRNPSVSLESLQLLFDYVPDDKYNWAGWSEKQAWAFWIMSQMAFDINQIDLLSLKRKQVKEGFFKFKNAKKEKRHGEALEITVFITPQLQKLMDKFENPDPDSEYFFRFLDLKDEDREKLADPQAQLKFKTSKENAYRLVHNDIISKKVSAFTHTMNNYMRKIAKKLGLPEDITSRSHVHPSHLGIALAN